MITASNVRLHCRPPLVGGPGLREGAGEAVEEEVLHRLGAADAVEDHARSPDRRARGRRRPCAPWRPCPSGVAAVDVVAQQIAGGEMRDAVAVGEPFALGALACARWREEQCSEQVDPPGSGGRTARRRSPNVAHGPVSGWIRPPVGSVAPRRRAASSSSSSASVANETRSCRRRRRRCGTPTPGTKATPVGDGAGQQRGGVDAGQR